MNSNEIKCNLDDLSSYKQTNIQFQDEGINLGEAGSINTINFVGDCIQAVKVGGKVNVFVKCPTTTTSTTSAPTTTTTSTIAPTTTTTTTAAPCNCYTIENLTDIALTYTFRPCGSNIITGSTLKAKEKKYFCSTPQGIPQQILGLTKVQTVGTCASCSPIFNTTTTTSSTTTSSSTTTTTTAPCKDLIKEFFDQIKDGVNAQSSYADVASFILDKGFTSTGCKNCCPECGNLYSFSGAETFLKTAEALGWAIDAAVPA